MSNKSILASNKFVDWTAKVSDNYSLPAYEKKGYTLAFRNEDDNYTKSYEEDLGQEPTDEIIESYSLQDIIDKYRVSPDYKNIRLAQTGDIYSGKKIDALLYYSGRGAAWNKYTTPIATLDIVHQAGFTKMEPAADSEDQNYDCSIDFTCPKCVPLAVYPSKQIHADGSIEEAVGLNAITPIVDFPTAGGNRPSEVYIGLLIKNNFSDKGYYFEGGIPDLSAGSEDRSEYSLAIGGENGLYNRFHKPYAEWLARDKEMLKVDLNLTASDIANLRLWVKVLVFNVRYLIKTLEITGNTTHDILHSNAELVEV